MSGRELLGLTLLVAGVVVSGWLINLQPGAPTPRIPTPGPNIGYYLEEAEIIDTAAGGEPLYTLTANRILHYPADDSVTLESVSVAYRSPEDSTWLLNADHGRIPGGGDSIELSGNVEIVNRAADDPTPTVIRTASLRYEPQAHLALTPDRVEVTYGRHAVAGQGMRAYLKDDKLELQSDVHGSFNP